MNTETRTESPKEREENKMMKIYKVEIEKVTFDRGAFDGYKLVGHYTNKEKAERVAEERYNNRNKVVEGKVVITEIEVDNEE